MKIATLMIEFIFVLLLAVFPLPALGYTLRGYVIDTTSDVSREGFAELARLAFSIKDNLADNGEKYMAHLEQMFDQRYRSNVIVRLKGDDTSLEATTDAGGLFLFEQILPGDYTLSALAPTSFSSEEGKMATGYTQISILPDQPQSDLFNVKIDAHAITVKGRVVNIEGVPVPSATVSAVQYIHNDIMNGRSAHANQISTMTDPDGLYSLSGILPENVLNLAGYFSDGNPSMWYELEVHAPNQATAIKKFVPLSEELLYPAQDLALLFSLFSENRENVELFHGSRPIPPKSDGNVIFVEDIILKRTDEPDAAKAP